MANLKVSSSFDPSADLILFNGDVRELLPKIPDNFVSLIVTSPPYNIGKEYEEKKELEDYIFQQTEIIRECYRILNNRGSICWQVGNFVENSSIIPLDIMLYPIFEELGMTLRNRIVWHFGHGFHATKRFSGRYEVILWFTKTDDYFFDLDPIQVPQKYPDKKYFKGPKKGQKSGNPLGKNPSDVWNVPNVKANHIEKTKHPCQFPVELIERLVLSMTNPGDWIFDPFMGVGTTAIASLIHERKSIGAEVIPDYYDIANRRIRLAQEGKLRVRPMSRKVYDPNGNKGSVPPPKIKIGDPIQPAIFERGEEYKERN